MSETAGLAIEEHQDPIGSRFGMWLFLFTEMLLFGGMFLLYAVYLNHHEQAFHYGSSELDRFIGTLNTIILLTSSLTMVLAVGSLQRQKTTLTVIFLMATILLGFIFLVNKYFEWSTKIHHGIFPGSEQLMNRDHGEVLFFGLYYVMTGLHGLHVFVGMVIMAIMIYFVMNKSHKRLSLQPNHLERFIGKRLFLSDETGNKIWESEVITDQISAVGVVFDGPATGRDLQSTVNKVENAGLYWHLVDIIWIFLFPLFYLISH